MVQLTPTAVQRLTEEQNGKGPVGCGLQLTWSDGSVGKIGSLSLRKNCPCASCLEARGEASHEKPLAAPRLSRLAVISATADEETNLELVWPVGNYALGVKWADGHDSGIYPYGLLRTLMEGNR